jgi:hypothetical protein
MIRIEMPPNPQPPTGIHMKMSRLVFFALLLSTGCAGNTIERDGFVLEKSKTEELLNDLQRRASSVTVNDFETRRRII